MSDWILDILSFIKHDFLLYFVCTIKGHLVYEDSWIIGVEENSKLVNCERCNVLLKITPDEDPEYEWVEEL